jgi:hypothetical protein
MPANASADDTMSFQSLTAIRCLPVEWTCVADSVERVAADKWPAADLTRSADEAIGRSDQEPIAKPVMDGVTRSQLLMPTEN